MTIYNIPSIVNQPLSNALTPKNIKSGFVLLQTNMFTDEDFSPYAVTDLPLQDNKSLENFGISDYHTSNWNLDVSSQSSISRLNTNHSPSEAMWKV
jgi:hypothetical protein